MSYSCHVTFKRFVHIFQYYYVDLNSSSTYINAQGFVSAPLYVLFCVCVSLFYHEYCDCECYCLEADSNVVDMQVMRCS